MKLPETNVAQIEEHVQHVERTSCRNCSGSTTVASDFIAALNRNQRRAPDFSPPLAPYLTRDRAKNEVSNAAIVSER